MASEQQFTIRINSSAQLQAVQETKKQLENSIQTTKALGVETKALETALAQVNTVLGSEAAKAVEAAEGLKQVIAATKQAGGDTKELQATLARVQSKFEHDDGLISRLTERFGKLKEAYSEKGGGLAGVVNAIGAGELAGAIAGLGSLAAAGAAAKKGLEEFAESEERVLSLEQSIANQGKLTQTYADSLRDLATEMEEATAIASADWIGVLEQLTKHGADSSNIEEYTEAVKNLAGLLGGNIEEAARAFSLALSGNYETLHRNGIAILENVTASEQLKSIMAQLEDRGMGILESKAKGLNGEWKAMKIAVSNLLESLGGLVASTGMVQFSLEVWTLALRKINSIFPDFHKNIDAATNRLPPLATALKGTGDAAQDSVSGIQSSESALEKLKKKYDEAKKSAEDFRQEQDEMGDAKLQMQLAYVDNAEAKGLISKKDARIAKAGFKMAANERAAKRAQDEYQEEEDRLRTQQNAAFNKYDDASNIASQKGANRDKMIDEARRYFGLESDQAIEQRKITQLLKSGHLNEGETAEKTARLDQLKGILASGKGLTYGPQGVNEAIDRAEKEFQQAEVASRNNPIVSAQLGMRKARMSVLMNLPDAVADAGKAEAAAAEAKANYHNVFKETSKRRETDETKMQQTYYQRTRSGLDNETEMLNAYNDYLKERAEQNRHRQEAKQSEREAELGFQMKARNHGKRGIGPDHSASHEYETGTLTKSADGYTGEFKANSSQLDGFARDIKTILHSQNQILLHHSEDLKRLGKEADNIRKQAANQRNKY